MADEIKPIIVPMKFTADTAAAKTELNALKDNLKGLASLTTTNVGGDQMVRQLNEASMAALKLKTQLEAATNVNTGNLDLTKFAKSLKQSGTSLEYYRTQLQSLGPQGQQAFLQLSSSIQQAEIPLIKINKLFSGLLQSMKQTVGWQLSSSAIHGVMNAIRSAYNYAQDLNESLNNIRIVSGQSTEQMAKFAENANRAAKALGATTKAYTDAALIYYQQGLNDQEVLARTDVTMKMANVTKQSAETVSDQMTAVWNNFAKGGQNLELFADKMVALGAATASSSSEIAEGLEKFAGVAETIGLSFDYAAAALTTITATTRQSADSVGTALKTLFSRLEGLKLGETLEDGTTLNQYSKALAVAGVNIKDANGELKNMDQILDETMKKWHSLTKDQQVALAQSVAGIRQYNQFMVLMSNSDFFKQNLNVEAGANGTLNKQQEIYAESWAAASKEVKASMESIYSDLIDDKFFIGLTQGLAKIIQFIDRLMDSLNGLPGILSLISTLVFKLAGDTIATKIRDMAFGFETIVTKGKNVAALKDQAANSAQRMIDELGPSASPEMKAQIDSYSRINTLQQALSKEAEHLTEEQIKERTNLIEIQKLREQENIKLKQAVADQQAKTESVAMEADTIRGKIVAAAKNKTATNVPTEITDALKTKYGAVQKNAEQRKTEIEAERKEIKRKEETGELTSEEAKKKTAELTAEYEKMEAAIKRAAQASKELGEGNMSTAIDDEISKTYDLIDQQLNQVTDSKVALDEYEQALQRLNELQNSGTASEEELAQATQAVTEAKNNLANAIGKTDTEMAKEINETEEFSDVTGKAALAIEQTEDSIQNERDTLASHLEILGVDEKHRGQVVAVIDKQIAAHDELAASIIKFNRANKSVISSFQQFGDRIKASVPAVRDYATAIVNGAQALSGLGMAMNAVKSIGNTLSNDEISTWEKMSTIMISVPMILGGVTGAIGGLTKTYKTLNYMVATHTALSEKNIAKRLQGLVLSKEEIGTSTQDAIVTNLKNLATGEELTQEEKLIFAKVLSGKETDKSVKKKFAEIVAKKLGITTTTAETIATHLNEKAIKKENTARGINIILQKLQHWWLLILIAAIGVLVGIIAAVVIAYNKQNEALKRANEHLKASSEAAAQAKEEYDGLKQKLDELAKSQETLEKLKKGTDEWAEAVADVNSKMLDLVKTYPELQQYLTVSKDGEYALSSYGEYQLKQLQGRKRQAMISTQLQQLNDQASVSDAKADKIATDAARKLSGADFGDNIKEGLVAIGKEIVNDKNLLEEDKIALLLNESTTSTGETLRSYIENSGLNSKYITALSNGLDDNKKVIREAIGAIIENTKARNNTLKIEAEQMITEGLFENDQYRAQVEKLLKDNKLDHTSEDIHEYMNLIGSYSGLTEKYEELLTKALEDKKSLGAVSKSDYKYYAGTTAGDRTKTDNEEVLKRYFTTIHGFSENEVSDLSYKNGKASFNAGAEERTIKIETARSALLDYDTRQQILEDIVNEGLDLDQAKTIIEAKAKAKQASETLGTNVQDVLNKFITEGTIDISSIAGDLDPEEIKNLLEMSNEELAEYFGLTEDLLEAHKENLTDGIEEVENEIDDFDDEDYGDWADTNEVVPDEGSNSNFDPKIAKNSIIGAIGLRVDKLQESAEQYIKETGWNLGDAVSDFLDVTQGVKEGVSAVKQGIEDTSNAVENLGNKANKTNGSLREIGGKTLQEQLKLYADGAYYEAQQLEAIKTTAKEMADKYKLDEEVLKVQAQEIRKLNDDLKLSGEEAVKLAVANQRLNKGVAALNKDFSTWRKSLSSIETAQTDYAEAVVKTTDALKDLLNLSDDFEVPDGFYQLEGVLDNIADASQGDEKAINKLGLTLAKATIENTVLDPFLKEDFIDLYGEEAWGLDQFDELCNKITGNIDKINNSLDELLEGKDLSDFIDVTEAAEQLNQLAIAANWTEDQFTDMMSNMSVVGDLTVHEVEYETSLPTYIENIADLGETTTEDGTKVQRYKKWTEQVASEKGKEVRSIPQISFSGEGEDRKPNIKYVGAGGTGKHNSKKRAGGISASSINQGSSKQKKIDKEIDKYHNTNLALDKVSKNLERIDKLKDSTYGKNHLAALDEEVALLEQQNKLLDQKIQENKEYLATAKEAVAVYGATFDEDGHISNFNELITNGLNTMADEYYDAMKEALEEYENTLKEAEELTDEKADAIRAILDAKLEKVEYVIEIKLDITDTKNKLLEWELSKLEDLDFKSAERIALYTQQAELNYTNLFTRQEGIVQALKKIGATDEQIADYLAGNSESIQDLINIDDKKLIDLLRNNTDNMIESLNTIKEIKKAIEEELIAAWEEYNDKINETLDLYDHIEKKVTFFKDLTDLLGVKRLGLTTDVINKIDQTLVNISKSRIESTKQQLKDQEELLATAEEKRRNATSETEIKYWDEFIKQVREKVYELNETLLEQGKALIDNLKQQFDDFVSNIFREFEEKLSGSFGSFEQMQDFFNQQKTLFDQYLPTYQKIYELSKMSRNITQQIAKIDSVKNQQKLRDLYEEITELQKDGVQMSKYDLDYLQKKYDLRLAEIALEEAQNNKTNVRLVRDSFGNYSYVYTANEDAVDSAQQKYEDAVYNTQKTTEDYINTTSEAFLKLQIEFESKAKQIIDNYKNGLISKEEYNKQMNQLVNFYTEQFNYINGQLTKGINNNKDLYDSELKYYENTRLGIVNATLDFKDTILGQIMDESNHDSLISYLQDFLGTLGSPDILDNNTILGRIAIEGQNLEQSINNVLKEITGTDLENFTAAVKEEMDIATTEIGQVESAVKQLSTQGGAALDTLANKVEEFQSKISPVLLAMEQSVTTLTNSFLSLMTAISGVSLDNDSSFGNNGNSPVNPPVGSGGGGKVPLNGDGDGPQDQEEGGTETKITPDYGNHNGGSQLVSDDPDLQVAAATAQKKAQEFIEGLQEYGQIPMGVYHIAPDKLIPYGIGTTTKLDNNSLMTNNITSFNKIQEEHPNLVKKLKTMGNKRTIENAFNIKLDDTKEGWSKLNFLEYKDKYYYIPDIIKGVANGTKLRDWLDKIDWETITRAWGATMATAATGMYTGEWGPEGKIAMLHEKELVLNKQDTKNILSTVDFVRSLSKNIDLQAMAQKMNMLTATNLLGSNIQSANQNMLQEVHIDASFPGVTAREEIEAAFSDLALQAAQYINRY